MKTIVQFAGVDVDDKAYHVSVFNPVDDSVFNFKCDPSPQLLMRALRKHRIKADCVKICYEASYIGFSLYRNLVKSGYCCQITAPSLIFWLLMSGLGLAT